MNIQTNIKHLDDSVIINVAKATLELSRENKLNGGHVPDFVIYRMKATAGLFDEELRLIRDAVQKHG